MRTRADETALQGCQPTAGTPAAHAAAALSERNTVVVDGEFVPVGTVIGHSAVLQSGYVDKIGDVPTP